MRFTIERLRTLLVVAAVLLVIALGVFLGIGRFKNRFIRKDLPHKLGINIQEEANGFVATHEVRGHMLYKIRASRQVQLKRDGKVFIQLHDVNIELYAMDGSRVDRIAGDEFEYDPNKGVAKALGPVEITLTKPTVAPAIAPNATASQALGGKQRTGSLASAAETAARGEIHVKTSGLIFNRASGEASTEEKVEFSLAQGSGSAMGAKYDSHDGLLILDHAVQLNVQRGADPVALSAQHAVFHREDLACDLLAATAHFRDDISNAQQARVYFRDDGSAERLEASKGFSLATSSGGRLGAPEGVLQFDEHSQPSHGHLQGGVVIDSQKQGRHIHGKSPTMELVFAGQGELRSAHLERGVEIMSDEETTSNNVTVRAHRTWNSPVADVVFRSAGNSKVELASIHGSGGVTVEAVNQRGKEAAAPEIMSADEVTGEFGPNGALKMMTGSGHTSIVGTTARGTRQTTSGDKLVARLKTPVGAKSGDAKASRRNGNAVETQIESATVEGNVVLTQQPPPKAGTTQPELRATAGHADYDDAGQLLHLTGSPRVTDGGLELTADKLDVSQESGDALALGNVKATWTGDPPGTGPASTGKSASAIGPGANFGAQGPTHLIAQQAELQRSSGAATFKGGARLWQQGNSVDAPVIVLNRTKQTLAATTTERKNPVHVVLVSAMGAVGGKQGGPKKNEPAVITVRGGDLRYSGAERKAIMRAGAVGSVISSTVDATTVSNQLELVLLPPGNHAGKEGAAAQVDRMTSTGHVEISSAGRRGTGEQLVYTSETGNYVLTGTAAAPPRLTDATRGTVTGQALIFNSRDDSVSIEGDGGKTSTVTTAPK